jgi:hypothetical protein
MKGEPGEGPMHEKRESRSYEKRESMREYGSKKDMSMSGGCKVNCQYPTGTIPSAKVSMGAQKTNPARRNRSY